MCDVADVLADVVKVRLMTDKTKQFHGVVHCVRTILVNEGPLAFYKGFGMCWGRVRIFVTTADNLTLTSSL